MTAALFRGPLRHDRAAVLASLAAVVLLAWAWLLLGGGLEDEAMELGGGGTTAMAPGWSPGYAALLFVMWTAMMVAMMLPSAAPVTLLVAAIERKRAGAAAHARTALFVLGYLAVWVAFAGAATALHWALDRAGLLSGGMALGNRVVTAGLLVAAGLYQTTPLKAACLTHCRSPLGFIMLHWRDGALGAVASGLRHGVFCLGCCWMLMLLLFVGGVMSVLWIGGIALLVLIEKTLPWGRHIGVLAGLALVASGAIVLATAF
jgi:predicted metal-binding membrane protein